LSFVSVVIVASQVLPWHRDTTHLMWHFNSVLACAVADESNIRI